MRVVLDANIWVSAAIRTGPAHRIVQSWLAGSASFEVVICPALIEELEEVLTQRQRMRKWIALDVAEHFVETLRVLADVVPDPVEVEATTRDVDDDYLVALAREHGADHIVTGDKDLLEWPDQRPPVLAPVAFAELVGE
jgi:putative PIN family toxin of toxin-antitoxin system